MADIVNIEGLLKLVEQLRARAAKARKDGDVSVAVSYTADYAIYVHEMPAEKVKTLLGNVARPSGLGVFWGPSQYGPKYLEGPMRELINSGEFKRIITEGMRRKMTLAQVLLIAGLRLQSDSQKVVPVEHDDLRASAQTTLERGE